MSSYDEHLISMAGGDGGDLDAIQRRADKATKGPWHVDGELDEVKNVITYTTGGGVIVGTYIADMVEADEDANFIANARTDVPELIALVRTQQATLAAVLNLANTSGRCGWRISADQLRRTLRGES